MRLDKFLVDCGVGSRSQVKSLLKKKQVTVNGEVETSPKKQVDEKHDRISCQGRKLTHETFVYYLLNKPKGVISATEDPQHKTVLDLLDPSDRVKSIFPVGRLDIDTTGLLLLTNNGKLAHAMLSPKKHVDKTYLAQVAGVMTQEDAQAFAQGISLKDHQCQPAKLEVLSIADDEETCQVRITISEGIFHQVKRMVAARGKEVLTLKRLTMGPLSLPDELTEGDYRRLSQTELAALEVFGQDL